MSTSHAAGPAVRRDALVPLVVALPLFLQNLDATVLATALPSMAASLRVPVLELNLAITAYLLSLVVFLPASAWLSSRFGARRMFCAAVMAFTTGSALCALAQNLPQLVACRLLQGVGGALMVPVGRTLLLRHAQGGDLVGAMVWFTVPGAIGRLLGPTLGGALVTVAPWSMIFLINIPFGLLGVLLALLLIEPDASPADPGERLDGAGLLLLGGSLAAMLGSVEMASRGLLSPWSAGLMAVLGLLALGAYAWRSRKLPAPLVDLSVLREPSFRIAVLGGFPIKLAVGALPFLLALLLQLGFGMPALDAGVLLSGMALGALATRGVLRWALQRIGQRRLLVGAALLSMGVIAGYGQLSGTLPRAWVFLLLIVGGLSTSAVLVSLNAIGYAQLPAHRHAHASTLAAMAHQLSGALGVIVAAALLSGVAALRHATSATPQLHDFGPVFAAVASLVLVSAWAFRRLPTGAAPRHPAPPGDLH